MLLFVVFIATLAFIFSKALGYGLSFVGIALIFSGLISIGSYYYSDKLVLATLKAREIEMQDNPLLFRTVENLCIGAGLPIPKIYIVNDSSPNAFATGRDPNHAVVCVTTGILSLLNKAELEGVIAHELSHIRNYDIRLMAVVAILVGFIAIIADMFMRSLWWGGIKDDDNRGSGNIQLIFLALGIVFAILSPIVATLIQLAVSRKREFLADASGALLTRYPEGLASALEKLEKDKTPLKKASNATAHLFIENPFNRKSSQNWFASLFNTHPSIDERIRILRSM
ncbi:MAG: zinc metalloprotease HtpX [Candidatus Levybacteria bacterium CG_4_9_14_3_um_filter_35_16]|nr:MAG: zinc metalloprotease HtpX [Candidatus Levybacteria bacterium CG22_combo_CG10-13_8_21_14_all_35_11]PIY94800.1 MAG: zinc metalloprotease HtpX [Candidatus Levybacteria bacterium CG_4_10_14_0_8_um_filter_35_23]PJA91193.1 MAG: zinc metalloprotease HtpX [Candidatus Levybacteria bacterium CG_4_9_14_3_um_filter_35_16]PJC54878.1 MAG: zinc metalloprotease HtpX [Candidatus Levybacteria bacterium CG_4_9_14_0_2_um_filter_35_21]